MSVEHTTTYLDPNNPNDVQDTMPSFPLERRRDYVLSEQVTVTVVGDWNLGMATIRLDATCSDTEMNIFHREADHDRA